MHGASCSFMQTAAANDKEDCCAAHPVLAESCPHVLLLLQCAIIVLAQPGTVLGYATQVTAVRKAVLAGQPYKALLINTLLPTVSHLQHTNYVLPFRYSLPLQMATLLVAVVWSKGMPCWLPLPHNTRVAAGGSSSSSSLHLGQLPDAVLLPWEVGPSGDSASSASLAPTGTALTGAADAGAAVEAFEKAGSQACRALQVIHALVWAPMAPPQAVFTTSAQALCQGPAAFQHIYLFTAALLLLVVPLTSVYCLEKMAKRNWCRTQGITLKPAGFWGIGGDSIGTGEGEGELRWQLPKAPVLVVVLLLVSGPWKLAESLTASMEAQCGATSGCSILAWLGSFC